jgi:excisionase family DNA binding protein
MDQNITLNDFLKEMLEPIIDDCVNRAMMKFMSNLPKESHDEDIIYDADEAAKYLKVSKQTLYGYVHYTSIVNYKNGKRLYFRKADLDDWIEQGRRRTQAEINDEADKYLRRKGRYNNL